MLENNLGNFKSLEEQAEALFSSGSNKEAFENAFSSDRSSLYFRADVVIDFGDQKIKFEIPYSKYEDVQSFIQDQVKVKLGEIENRDQKIKSIDFDYEWSKEGDEHDGGGTLSLFNSY